MKFNGSFMYQGYHMGNVHIGYRMMGHMILNDEGLMIMKPSDEFCRITGFGKVDGVDLFEGDMV